MLYFLVGILTFLAVAFFLYSLGRTLEPVAELDERIETWVTSHQAKSAQSGETRTFLNRMERRIARQSFGEQTATELARADMAITVSEYLFIRVGLVAGGVLAGYVIGHNLILTLALGLAGFFLPVFYLRSRQGRRLRAFCAQLPDVLDHMVGSLRAGYGLLQAVEWVARQVPPPAGAEFDRIIREVQLGRSLSDALNEAVRRIDSDDLALIVTAIQIQHEVGGSLADILDTVAETIRERVRIQREILVLTAQQRYSGYVLMLMPIALAFILFLLNPEYESQLFTPGPTLCIPITTLIMMVIGFFVMRRIVEIEI